MYVYVCACVCERVELYGENEKDEGKRGGETGGVRHEESELVYSAEWRRDRRGKRKRERVAVAGRRGEIGHKKLEEKLR